MKILFFISLCLISFCSLAQTDSLQQRILRLENQMEYVKLAGQNLKDGGFFMLGGVASGGIATYLSLQPYTTENETMALFFTGVGGVAFMYGITSIIFAGERLNYRLKEGKHLAIVPASRGIGLAMRF